MNSIKGIGHQVSSLLEEIVSLDKLINLHLRYNASQAEIDQYEERRKRFIEELDKLLSPYGLKISQLDRAA